jgi:hypothetical protein
MEQNEYQTRRMILKRRTFLQVTALSLLAACTKAQAAVYHDPECGCCNKWIKLLAKDGRYSLKTISALDRTDLHRRIGMPPELASCHTAIIAGYAFEGHVPLADLERLLAEKPSNISGLAVPGMPIGSPGMESSDAPQHFSVIAFGGIGQSEYARY